MGTVRWVRELCLCDDSEVVRALCLCGDSEVGESSVRVCVCVCVCVMTAWCIRVVLSYALSNDLVCIICVVTSELTITLSHSIRSQKYNKSRRREPEMS